MHINPGPGNDNSLFVNSGSCKYQVAVITSIKTKYFIYKLIILTWKTKNQSFDQFRAWITKMLRHFDLWTKILTIFQLKIDKFWAENPKIEILKTFTTKIRAFNLKTDQFRPWITKMLTEMDQFVTGEPSSVNNPLNSKRIDNPQLTGGICKYREFA